MEFNLNIELLKFLVTIGAILLGIAVITSKNPIIALFNLITLYLLVAIYLIIVGIAYMGISYIIIYVGAIAILFLFIIMMIDIEVVPSTTKNRKTTPLIFVLFFAFIYIMSQFVKYLELTQFTNSFSSKIKTIYLELINLDDQLSIVNLSNNSIEASLNLDNSLHSIEDSIGTSLLNSNYKEENISIDDNVIVDVENHAVSINNNIVQSIPNKNINLGIEELDILNFLYKNFNNTVIKGIIETHSDTVNFVYYSVITPTWDSMLGNITQVAAISENLYSTYSSFLYILSVLLLLGMIGAIILTGTDSHGIKIVSRFNNKKTVHKSSILKRNEKKQLGSYQLIGLFYLSENPIFNKYSSYFDLFTSFISKIIMNKDIIISGIILSIGILFVSWCLYFIIKLKIIKKKTLYSHQEKIKSSHYSVVDIPLQSKLIRDDKRRIKLEWIDNEWRWVEVPENAPDPRELRRRNNNGERPNNEGDDPNTGDGGPNNGAGDSGNGTGANGTGNDNGTGNGTGNDNNNTNGNNNGTGNDNGNSNGTNNNGNGAENNGNNEGDQGNSTGSEAPSMSATEAQLRSEWEDALRRVQEARPELPNNTEAALERVWDNIDRFVPRETTPEDVRVNHISRMLDTFRETYGLNGSGTNGGGTGANRGVIFAYFVLDSDNYLSSLHLFGRDVLNYLISLNWENYKNLSLLLLLLSLICLGILFTYFIWSEIISKRKIKLFSSLKDSYYMDIYEWNIKELMFFAKRKKNKKKHKKDKKKNEEEPGRSRSGSPFGETEQPGSSSWEEPRPSSNSPSGEQPSSSSGQQPGSQGSPSGQQPGGSQGSPSGQQPGSPSGRQPHFPSVQTEESGSSSEQREQRSSPSSPRREEQRPTSSSGRQRSSGSPLRQQPSSSNQPPTNPQGPSSSNTGGIGPQPVREPTLAMKRMMVRIHAAEKDLEREFRGSHLPDINETWETYMQENPDWTEAECLREMNGVLYMLQHGDRRRIRGLMADLEKMKINKGPGPGPGPGPSAGASKATFYIPFFINDDTSIYFSSSRLFIHEEYFSLNWISILWGIGSLIIVCSSLYIYYINVGQIENSRDIGWPYWRFIAFILPIREADSIETRDSLLDDILHDEFVWQMVCIFLVFCYLWLRVKPIIIRWLSVYLKYREEFEKANNTIKELTDIKARLLKEIEWERWARFYYAKSYRKMAAKYKKLKLNQDRNIRQNKTKFRNLKGLVSIPFFLDYNSDSISYLIGFPTQLGYFVSIIVIISLLLLNINIAFSISNIYVAKGGGFECGFTGFLQTRERYNVVFYKVGILFLMFDLEIFVTFPFPVGSAKAQILNILSVLAFLYVLMFGLSFELKKGTIDFEKRPSI